MKRLYKIVLFLCLIFAVIAIAMLISRIYKEENENLKEYFSSEETFLIKTEPIELHPKDKKEITIEGYIPKDFTWISENEEIATIDENYNIVAVSPGTTTIIIKRTENDYLKLPVMVVS